MTAAPPVAPAQARRPVAPARARAGAPGVTRTLLVPAAAGAAGAVAMGLVVVELVVLAAWATDPRSATSAGSALRLGAAVWLAALHTRIHVGAVVFGLAPLGLTVAVTLLLARAAAAVARTRLSTGAAALGRGREVAAVTAAVAVPHAAIAAGLAGFAGTDSLHPSPLTALIGGLAVSLAGGPLGVLRAQRKAGMARLRDVLPPDVEAVLSGAVVAVAVLGAVAAMAAAALLARHAHAFGADRTALAPGAAGGGALTLLQMSAIPNAVVWAGSWFAGPGFAVGAGSSVTPWGTTLGQVPALPLLAGLPAGRSGLGSAVLVLPVLAGALAAGLVLRRRAGDRGALALLGLAVGTAPVAGLLAAAAAAASDGSAGPGRLATVGASPGQVGLALAAEVAVGAVLAVAAFELWRHRSPIAAATRSGTSSGAGHVRVLAGAGAGRLSAGAHAGVGRLAAARTRLSERRTAPDVDDPPAEPTEPTDATDPTDPTDEGVGP